MTPAAKPRVSDERLVTMAAVCQLERQPGHEPDNVTYRGNDARGLVLDLRDARAENARHATVIADANAAILRLQKRLDAVRPVVKAAVGFQAWLKTFGMVVTPREYAPEQLRKTVSALPAADREWALKGE